MLPLRKIDLYLQALLLLFVAVSIPPFFSPVYSRAVCTLAVWQSLSAGINANAFINCGYKQKLSSYGIYALAGITALLIVPLCKYQIPASVLIYIHWAGILTYIMIAFYYLKIYNSVIRLIDLRTELSALIRGN
jgi:hypothetical protein